MDYDFVIAGGGIGGTVLAHLLGRRGKRVLVLEKSLGPPGFIRPEGLWPATAALLKMLLPASETDWVPLRGIRAFNGSEPILSIGEDVFERAGVRLAMTDPNRTRERLMKLPTFELRRGVEVVGILKENNRIAGVRSREVAGGKESEIRAALTVGDDGVHSRVREACGIELRTRDFPVDLMTFGFAWPASLPQAVVHIFLNPNRTRSGIFALGAAPMPEQRGCALVPVRPKRFDANNRAVEDWAAFLACDARLQAVAGARKFPSDLARIRRPWGHAARYGTEGAVLIGDAAHPVSPAAGQGANMAVADAVALADVILSGRPDIVLEYERRRRPANERSIEFTRRASQALRLPAQLIDWLLPHGARYVQNHPDVIEHLLHSASSAFKEDSASDSP